MACFMKPLHTYAKVAPAQKRLVLKPTTSLASLMIKATLSGSSQLSSQPRWRTRDIIHLSRSWEM